MAPEGNADNGGAPLLSRKGEHLGSATADMAKYSIPEHGYALTGNPADGTGGWLAHRRDVDVPGSGPGNDWVLDLAPMSTEALRKYGTDLSAAMSFRPRDSHAPRMLVLYGSLRPTSFSRKCAYECARILEVMGADVRVYNPKGLPPRDPTELEAHPKVVELRNLALWSESHVWVSPEMHGTITGVFKNQIDWIPLNTGSVRPTQGRTCAVLQVNGGSQSFNVVNELRRLARWMRMICTTNQSSIAKAWQEFDDDGRLKDSSYRDRLIDVMEEHFKMTVLTRTHADFLVDRFSERREIVAKGKLLTQAEKEAEKEKMAAPHTALDDVLPKCCDNPGPGCVPDPGWLELKEEALAEAAAKEAGQGRP